MASFRLAKRAEVDLDEIWLTIALDNVDAADRVIDTLYGAAGLLAAQPRLGRARSELGAELRSFVTRTPYII
jgi:toxin ParE1/3/4